MRYRRARVDGGTYFFTINLMELRRSLLVDYIDVLRKVVGMVKERHPFTIDAMVILPSGDADYSGRWICRIRGITGLSRRG